MNRNLRKNRQVTFGITGGIGAGKSVVSHFISVLGIPVFNSDIEAKILMNNDAILRSSIKAAFGNAAYTSEGLNRKYLSDRIFENPEIREALNALVHPAVRLSYTKWLLENSSHPVLAREAAIMLETDSFEDLDHILLVTAPEPMRIDRVMKRDGFSRREVEARIKAQWSDEKRRRYASYEVVNDDQTAIIPQVLSFLRKVSSLA